MRTNVHCIEHQHDDPIHLVAVRYLLVQLGQDVNTDTRLKLEKTVLQNFCIHKRM